jgi:hypothetical protein
VRIALQEDAATVRSPAYFGGTASPAAQSAAFSIPVPTLDTSASQFTANFVSGGFLAPPQIAVSYTGNNNLLASYATNWSLTPIANGTACTGAGSTGNPAATPVKIDLGSCYYGNQGATWQVAITFSYFGQAPSTPYLINVSGTGPQPIDPANVGNFAATYTPGTAGGPATITLTYSGGTYDDATLAKLTWSENVSSDNGTGCGAGSQPASATTPITLTVDGSSCPPTSTTTPAPPTGSPSGSAPPSGSGPTPVVKQTTYTIDITFTDPNYGTTGHRTATVQGS